MKRFLLSLPVVLLGLPLLGCLILAQTRPQGAMQVGDALASLGADVPSEKPPPRTDRLPSNAEMEELLRKNPMAFLENTLEKYRREVKTGYHLTLWKHEIVNGVDLPQELIDVHYREKPYSVHFRWLEGAGKAQKVLYVEGENKDGKGKSQMLVQPNGGFLGKFVVVRDPHGADARASAHYPLDDFGFYNNQGARSGPGRPISSAVPRRLSTSGFRRSRNWAIARTSPFAPPQRRPSPTALPS